MTDTSLVVESGQAKHCQAQLTRLQMALGLKKELKDDDLKKLTYGQTLPAIEPNVPTGFSRKGDAILVSVDLRVKYEDESLTQVAWAVRSFDTGLLQDTASKDCMQQVHKSRTFGGSYESANASSRQGLLESNLGDIRRAIDDTLEPMCLDHCDNPVHKIEQSDHSQGKNPVGLCNLRRRVCDNTAHDNDENNFNHRRHKTCKPRGDIILLISEKESCLRDLQMLGCDPLKHLHIVDIVSVRELFQAYLNRQDYYIRNPFTGKCRTTIDQDWDNLSADHQIWMNLGYSVPAPGVRPPERNARSLLHLKAAVTIACRDALPSKWLRTLEQVDGGLSPGPWRRLRSQKEVQEFLVADDVARVNAISRKALEERVAALLQHLPSLSRDAYGDLIEKLAKIHNYVQLLSPHFKTPSDDSSTASSNVSKDVNDIPRHHKAEDEAPVSPTSSTSFKTATATPSTAATPALPPLPKGAVLNYEAQKYCQQYHRDQEDFEKELRDVPVSPEHKEKYDSLFDWKPYKDQRGRSKATPITCEN